MQKLKFQRKITNVPKRMFASHFLYLYLDIANYFCYQIKTDRKHFIEVAFKRVKNAISYNIACPTDLTIIMLVDFDIWNVQFYRRFHYQYYQFCVTDVSTWNSSNELISIKWMSESFEIDLAIRSISAIEQWQRAPSNFSTQNNNKTLHISKCQYHVRRDISKTPPRSVNKTMQTNIKEKIRERISWLFCWKMPVSVRFWYDK